MHISTEKIENCVLFLLTMLGTKSDVQNKKSPFSVLLIKTI